MSMDFSDVREQFFYGAKVDAAYDVLISLQSIGSRPVTTEVQLRFHEMLRAPDAGGRVFRPQSMDHHRASRTVQDF
jgi:hypothetical protein